MPISSRRVLLDYLPIPLEFKREPKNQHDPNAISVWLAGKPYRGMQIGYLRRTVAEVWAPAIDSGKLKILSGKLTAVDPEVPEVYAVLTIAGKGY
jgi:hypothetical protein